MRHAFSFLPHIRDAIRAHVPRAVEQVSSARFAQEPAYTAAFLARLEGTAYEATDGPVTFTATNVNSIGTKAPECWSGADLAITADIRKAV